MKTSSAKCTYCIERLCEGTSCKRHNVPATRTEAVNSDHLLFLEKTYSTAYFFFVNAYKEKNSSTYHFIDLAEMNLTEYMLHTNPSLTPSSQSAIHSTSTPKTRTWTAVLNASNSV